MKKFKDIKKVLIAVIVVSLFALLVFGCTPQANTNTSAPADTTTDSTGDTPAATVAFTMDIDCGICHTKQQDTLSDQTIPASVHATNGASCITCHDDEANLIKVHDGVSAAGANDVKNLRVTKITEDLCLGCHANYKEMTVGTPPLVDAQGTEVDPHNYPATDGHKSITCSSCHTQHRAVTAHETAEKLCMSCHHEEVFECYTCHS